MRTLPDNISIIIPAKNEAQGLKLFLPELRKLYPQYQIIVVDDGSNDDTAKIALECHCEVVTHPYSVGNGGAIKSGARAAKGDVFIFMDADGQHQPQTLLPLLNKYREGFDMVVGARNRSSQANLFRWFGNTVYNKLASLIVGQQVLDLTSGLRVVNAKKFKEFLHLLPNGFSAPSTITLAFFRTGYTVAYEQIPVQQRLGKSHLRPITDGIRFFLILYKMTILYSPLKVFFPLAFLHLLAGIGNYAYTFYTQGRFTNMSALLLSAAVIIFLIGVVSEQITSLMYQRISE